MRAIKALAVGFGLAAGMTAPAAAVSFRVDGVFEGALTAQNPLGGSAYQLILNYDPATVTYTDTTPTSFNTFYGTNDSGAGTFSLSITGNTWYFGQTNFNRSGEIGIQFQTFNGGQERRIQFQARTPGQLLFNVFGSAAVLPGPFLPGTMPGDAALGTRGFTCSCEIGFGYQGWQYGNGRPLITPLSGTGGVPEPASWAMLMAGFGLTGALARRRRQMLRVVAA